MWSLKKTVPPYINKINIRKKKVKGDASIFIFALCFIFFMVVILKMTLDKQRIYVTYDTVDDSIVAALTSACTFNVEEYALSGQAVIYDTVTELLPSPPPVPGATPPPVMTEEEKRALEMQKARDALLDTKLLYPITDTFLNKSYSDFMRALKRNLKLDDHMNCHLSGIEGTVAVNEFSVYNRYEQFDKDGNLLAFRVIKYTYNGSTWSVYPYNIDTDTDVYNSYDKAYTPIDATTVTASLTFDVRLSDYAAQHMPGLTPGDMTQTVTYQRLVDIKKN